jgi:peptidoglycan/LPS O-acetylase OafA/YrhL
MIRRSILFLVVALLLALGAPQIFAAEPAPASTAVVIDDGGGVNHWEFHYEGPLDLTGRVTWNGHSWTVGELLAVALIFYFLPALIAFLRGHPARWGILVLNFLAGFTVIGWLGSLVWAFIGGGRRPVGAT